MNRHSIEDIQHIYGIDGWGKGYFNVNDQGHLTIQTTSSAKDTIDIYEVVQDLLKQGVPTPCLLRFPEVLSRRVEKINTCFGKSIQEFGYKGHYLPVFPIKVNQQRAVVDGLLKGSQTYPLGIEAGSKPELMVALGQPAAQETITICNGFKDQEYFELASVAAAMGRKIVVVIEKPFELRYLKTLQDQGMPMPMIGFRIKLTAKGSGLWEKSGGHASKFGLTTMQLLQSMDWLKENNLLDQFRMLHFHIGSQITEIRKIKAAMREAARVYAKVQKMDVQISYLDVGGGLGVDYDGSKTSSDASVNYTIGEYANDVIYTIREVCDEENVPHPTIITESGRALASHHSMLIMDVRDVIREDKNALLDAPKETHDTDAKVIEELAYIDDNISVKNFREFYHDAVEKKDELQSLFNLGMIGIRDRARGEWLYQQIAIKAVRFSKSAKFVADEFVELEEKLYHKMVCNFSVFQSIPDHWALDQLFPVAPIHRLHEYPSEKATLVDITCDSDGEIEKFVDLKDIKHALEVHSFDVDRPYYLGILMIGAYQDTMGDLHNLFGAVHQAQVMQDAKNGFSVTEIHKGDTCADTISMYGHQKDRLQQAVSVALQEAQKEDLDRYLNIYASAFESYTYLGE